MPKWLVNDVHDMDMLSARLRDSTSLPEMLAASFDAFEAIRLVARECEDRAPDLFAAFITAGSAAADGREAIADVPALGPPDGIAAADGALAPGTDPGAIADALAALAALLASQLELAASLATPGGDRVAFQEARRAASEIHQLLVSR